MEHNDHRFAVLRAELIALTAAYNATGRNSLAALIEEVAREMRVHGNKACKLIPIDGPVPVRVEEDRGE